MSDVDVVVIGAGVVGLACAARLARDGRSVLVVERHEGFGRETSSRSSEVVHAGMYYPPGSRKARLCVRGNEALPAWCQARNVAHARVGKLIVATSTDEEAALEGILARGRENGSRGLAIVGRDVVERLEPNVIAIAALWSPFTGIVDSHGFMASLVADARAHGADFVWRHEVIGLEPGAAWTVRVRDASGDESAITATRIVNAAGLFADRVAALAGVDVDAAGYRITFFKGSYFRVHRRGLVSRLIYPVPPPSLPGLGIHLTVELDGGIRLGPDVEPRADRTLDYAVDEGRRERFFRAASRYVRGLSLDALAPDQSGMRPKLTVPDGAVPDFVIAEESARGLPGLVNLIGIESPGLTSALPIADEVAALV